MRSTRVLLARIAATPTSFSRWLTRASLLVLALAAVAATAHPTAGTSATAGQGNAVTDWNEIAQNAIVVGRPAGSSAVLEGIVQAAIYDATSTRSLHDVSAVISAAPERSQAS